LLNRVKGSPSLLAFTSELRLYEHYRARARFIASRLGDELASASGLELQEAKKQKKQLEEKS